MLSEGLRDVCSVLQLIDIYSTIKDSNFKLLADILNPRIVIIISFLCAAAVSGVESRLAVLSADVQVNINNQAARHRLSYFCFEYMWI